MATSEVNMQVDDASIDEGLYSRQLYVLGHDAMKKMATSTVLIVGMQGLGVEIAKNVCLAGVKSVAIYDPDPVSVVDLGTQFFLREEDIGKPRAQATVARLAELNSYVPVRCLEGSPGQPLTPAMLNGFQVVVLTNTSWTTQQKVNAWCRDQGIYFIAAETRGLFGSVFNDFGDKFTCIDINGEQPLTGMVVSITRERDGLVTCLDETRHGLEDGDYVTFSEVEGMVELNGCAPRKISVKGPYTFTIGDTSDAGEYISGGLWTQVKVPKLISFKSMAESLKNPEYFITDFAKFNRPATLHAGFQALSALQERLGRLPHPRNTSDADEVVREARAFASSDQELDENLLRELSFQSTGDLAPMNALIGGFVAQEVLKACSSKFHPMVQHLYVDALESLPSSIPSEYDCSPSGSRYDGQIAVFGKSFQDKIENYRQFLVGAGAIGCEMLKNWSLMGLGTGSKGVIHVTDLDTIEKSNLNRQFLFRVKDLGKFKSEAASIAVMEMNPALKDHIKYRQDPVGPDTEHVYGDEFYSGIDGVTNALDNIKARLYMDGRCITYKKPLLDSGTLGTKGNVQIVVPYLTESYASSQDPPEKETPMCTVKNFPNAINHCIEWSRAYFDILFVKPAQAVNSYLSDPSFLEATLRYSGDASSQLQLIASYLVTDRPLTFEACIVWARSQFEESYNNSIQQLLFSLPRDHVTSNGQPFWSGPKRAPEPLEFDFNDPLHMNFIVAAANLHAFNYGLKGESDLALFRRVLGGISVPKFVPKSGIKVQVNDSDPVPDGGESVNANEIARQLPPPASLAGYRMVPVEFEKDDDSNHHIDFITAASNLRATNYSIAIADRHTTKRVAGKIIPAIATTTSLVTGLACLELYKLIDGKQTLEKYSNSFVNLALPFFGFSDPVAPKKLKYGQTEWTLWDRFVFEGNPTLQYIITWFKKEHNLEISMVSQGVSMLWSLFVPKKKQEERLPLRMKDLVELVSKKPVPAHVKHLLVEVVASDEDGEDVEVPTLFINL